MLDAVDSGWFGLRALRTHAVICGFPRSGSTLLLLMAETCVADAKTFGTESYALDVARRPFRNHPLMITKHPEDTFNVDEIRAFYARRRADVRFILTVRDPRAILTSRRKGYSDRHPDGYYQAPPAWKVYYEAFRYARQFDGVVVVKFEDLVRDPGDVQRRLTDFVGWTVRIPFDQFHAHASPEFRFGDALNGLRPLDSSRIDAWRKPEHREKIRSILRALPEFPEYLIDLGYEADDSWAREYLD
jgi:hypothetical protein